MLGWISKRWWVTAVSLRIRVFWRTKLSVAVIHPPDMKLEASYSWVFHNLYLLEVKAMPSLIYHRLKAWRLCFSSYHPSCCSGDRGIVARRVPFYIYALPLACKFQFLIISCDFFKGHLKKIHGQSSFFPPALPVIAYICKVHNWYVEVDFVLLIWYQLTMGKNKIYLNAN